MSLDVDDGKMKGLLAILVEQAKKKEECEKRGHSNSEFTGTSGLLGSPRARYFCHDCGMFYDKALTDEQWEKYQKRMQEPFMKSG